MFLKDIDFITTPQPYLELVGSVCFFKTAIHDLSFIRSKIENSVDVKVENVWIKISKKKKGCT
jgi:hypothetical protein